MEKQSTTKKVLKEETEKTSRNRPYFTTFGKHKGQSVLAYKGRREILIRDQHGNVAIIDPDEADAVILAILEMIKKSKT